MAYPSDFQKNWKSRDPRAYVWGLCMCSYPASESSLPAEQLVFVCAHLRRQILRQPVLLQLAALAWYITRGKTWQEMIGYTCVLIILWYPRRPITNELIQSVEYLWVYQPGFWWWSHGCGQELAWRWTPPHLRAQCKAFPQHCYLG